MSAKVKRKSTTDMICKWMDKVDKTKEASTRYREVLTAMSDEEFHAFMESLRDGEDVLYVNIPNLKNKGVTFENNLTVGKQLGIEFFQHLTITDAKTGKEFLTPKKYIILHLPIRRQIQTIESGLSVADDESRIDPTTGQVVGSSQAASLSVPETFVLYSKGLLKSNIEMTKVRGGDTDALQAVYGALIETGQATLEDGFAPGTRATSTETLGTYLKAMHIDNNI